MCEVARCRPSGTLATLSLSNPWEAALSTPSGKNSFFFSPEATLGERKRKEYSGKEPKIGGKRWVGDSSLEKGKTFPKGILFGVEQM